MNVDPIRDAMRYVDNGWPETEAAYRFGLDVDELRAALAERPRQDDPAWSRQRDTWDTTPSEPDPQHSRPARRVRGEDMNTVQAEPIHWLWPGYLARGKLHVLDGDPGLGKSTVTLDLAARLTVGAGWPDGAAGGKPSSVVLLSAEDDPADTIRPRLDLAGADCSRVFHVRDIVVTTVDRDGKRTQIARPILLPDDIDDLAATVQAKDAGLLIIDPLMAYLSGDVNSYRDQDVRRALAPLARMAEQTNIAVVLVRHLNKSNGANPLYRGGGSIGIIGAARLGFLIAADPNDPRRRVLAPTKTNLAVAPASLAYRLQSDADTGCARVDWEPDPVAYTAPDLLQDADESAEDRDERRDATKWLASYLVDNGGEAEAVDIFKAGAKVGFSQNVLRRARRRGGISTRKTGMDAGWMWQIALEGDTEGDEDA